MIIYHGSDVIVDKPVILQSERKLDFGDGFYTTSNREQAVRWSERVSTRRKSNAQIISEYEFDFDGAEKALDMLLFHEPDEKWLDFVAQSRSGFVMPKPYDIAVGPVADDDVYGTIILYEQGFLDKESALKRLKIKKLFNQILFHTDRSLLFCHYIRHDAIGGTDG